jgi:hypothetical protein
VVVGPLICFAAYIGLLQSHSDDMSRVVDQLLKFIATFIGLSCLSRSRIICCINVFTSLLGLVIVSHLSPRGLGRFIGVQAYCACGAEWSHGITYDDIRHTNMVKRGCSWLVIDRRGHQSSKGDGL